MRSFFRIMSVIVSFLLVSLVVCGAGDKENISGKSYVLMEADTCTVIEGSEYSRRLKVGALSKLMSILLIAEDIDSGEFTVNDILTASDSVTGTKGSVIWLESGDKLSVDELLKSVIVGNSNDALTVLAERSAGDIGTFIADMNARAFDLGLKDTYFESPYGYSGEAAYSSAHDIAVICAELSKHDFLTHYFRIWRDFVKNGQVELVNENELARTYGSHIGFKACHSDECGYCIAEAARGDDGSAFIAVILGDNEAELCFKSSKKLLKKAFNGYKLSLTMFPDEMLAPLRVKNGTESAVEICISRQGKAVVPVGSSELRTKVVIPEYISAPVREGQAVGTAAFYNGDNLVFEADIITKSPVQGLRLPYVIGCLLFKLIEK